MDQVYIAIIGAAGLIGIRHVSHVLSNPDTSLSSIVDPTPAGEALAKEKSIPHFPSVCSLLAARSTGHIRVDAAIIATPNHTHVPIGLELLAHDITILVEKPVSTSASAATDLLKAEAAAISRGSKARVLVGHHRRFNTYIRATKKLLATGKLGQVIAFQGTWALLKDLPYFNIGWRSQPGSGGPVLINLIHEVDNLRYLFGDITRVYVEKGGVPVRNLAVEETAVMTLRFQSGVVGTFLLSDTVASPYNWESATGENPHIPQAGQSVYTVFGTKGSVSVPEMRRWHYDSASALPGSNGEPGTTGSWNDTMEFDDSPKADIDDILPFDLQLAHLVDVVRGISEPNCSGSEGARDISVIEAVKKSMQTGLPVEVEHI
ncbi:hypothetical protein RUND412_006155 [Rhizina undulata]